ncbi:MAG: FxsA family protein [Actinomycetes bacterium]
MGALLVVAFLLVPVVEIYVIIQVGHAIGALPTVVLLVVESLIGAWLLKREGRSAWSALREAAASGRLPGRELADAGLVLVGGTLLLTPGFVTDVVGFFFVLPPTRPLARRVLLWFVARRAARALGGRGAWATMAYRAGSRGPTTQAWNGPLGPPRVVQGETVPEGGADQGPDDKGPGRVAGG